MKSFRRFCIIASSVLFVSFQSCRNSSSPETDAPVFAVSVQEHIRLYDGEAPGSEGVPECEGILTENRGEAIVLSVSTPTLTAYIPQGEGKSDAAVIVLPGGGFKMLSIDKEGTNIARWYAEHGITAFVLRYRILYCGNEPEEAKKRYAETFTIAAGQSSGSFSGDGPSRDISGGMLAGSEEYIPLAADDLRRSIEYVRENASSWGVDPSKIAVNGCSAGCRTALNVVFNHDEKSRPDLVVALYGNTDIGEMPQKPMPIIFVAPENDIYGVPTAFEIYKMWQQARIPAELHYFTGTNHGFGLLDDDAPVHKWPSLVWDFMHKTGFLKDNNLIFAE